MSDAPATRKHRARWSRQQLIPLRAITRWLGVRAETARTLRDEARAKAVSARESAYARADLERAEERAELLESLAVAVERLLGDQGLGEPGAFGSAQVLELWQQLTATAEERRRAVREAWAEGSLASETGGPGDEPTPPGPGDLSRNERPPR